MRKIAFVYILILASCWSQDLGFYPYRNHELPINHVKLYKGFIFVNDSLSFSGSYYRKTGSFKDKNEEKLYGNLLVGDTLITDEFPKDYVIRRRNGIDTKFFTWPLNEQE